MQPGDIRAGLRLSGQNNWNQTAADWRRLMQWEPEGCFVLDVDGQVMGTVTTTCYGTALAWIGMLLVDAASRHQGFGRRLLLHALAWLEQCHVHAMMLDATPLGQPLYESLGFRQRYPLERWQGVAASAGGIPPAVLPLDQRGLAGPCLALDRRAFGLDRGRLLRDLLAVPDARGFRTGGGAAIEGFVLLRPGAARWHIGPLVADNAERAAAMLQAAMEVLEGRPVQIDVPGVLAAVHVARRAGLTPARPFIRMLRGSTDPVADLTLIYATAAPEIG
jgi:GNAT superfamily N-acetyltransferase